MTQDNAIPKRDRQLNIALRSDELARLQRRADAVGLRLVPFARAILLNEGVRVETITNMSTCDRLTYQQWVRVGQNLNQMVRQLNRFGSVSAAEVEAVLQDIRDLIAEARR
jgi:hypothetical protein